MFKGNARQVVESAALREGKATLRGRFQQGDGFGERTTYVPQLVHDVFGGVLVEQIHLLHQNLSLQPRVFGHVGFEWSVKEFADLSHSSVQPSVVLIPFQESGLVTNSILFC